MLMLENLIRLAACVAVGASTLLHPTPSQSEELGQLAPALSGSEKFSGAIFKIQKDGKFKGYVFGSIHMGYKGVEALPRNVSIALKNSNTYYREADMSDTVDLQNCNAATLYNLPNPQTLRVVLSDDIYLKLHGYLANRKFTPEQIGQLDHLTPFGLVNVIGSPANPPELDGSKSIDDMLDNVAAENKIRISGLEKPCESTKGFGLVTQAEWNAYVNAYIDFWSCEKCERDMNAFLARFVRMTMEGDVDEVARSYQSAYSNIVNVGAQQEKLFFSRNANMARKISALAARDEVFFVSVGAIHLGGPNGVNQRLRDMGYRVEPVH